MKNEIDVIKFLVSSEINKKIEKTRQEIYDVGRVTRLENNQLINNTLEQIERKFENALNEVRSIKTELEKQKNEFDEKLKKLSDLLDIVDLGINKNTLLQLFKDNEKNKEWFKYNSSDLETMRSDYNKASKKITANKKSGVFENMAKQITDSKLDTKKDI